jgi:hypothetical protein
VSRLGGFISLIRSDYIMHRRFVLYIMRATVVMAVAPNQTRSVTFKGPIDQSVQTNGPCGRFGGLE